MSKKAKTNVILRNVLRKLLRAVCPRSIGFCGVWLELSPLCKGIAWLWNTNVPSISGSRGRAGPKETSNDDDDGTVYHNDASTIKKDGHDHRTTHRTAHRMHCTTNKSTHFNDMWSHMSPLNVCRGLCSNWEQAGPHYLGGFFACFCSLALPFWMRRTGWCVSLVVLCADRLQILVWRLMCGAGLLPSCSHIYQSMASVG